MKNTTNYGLNKPETTDYYDVEHQNENMDTLDAKLKEVEESASGAKANVDDHIANKENPHNITKEQVGLSNVPNVSTNNQTPTYAVAEKLAELTNGEKLSVSFGKIARAVIALIFHCNRVDNPHNVTKAQLGLGNVENTSDSEKPVSTATQAAIDAAYANSNYYTDEKIAELINGAPTTMDTLGEIANTMTENQDVVEALHAAVGSKANESEFSSHVANSSNPHNVTKTQVGLGNVPNVTTNNQTPTYTVASANTALTSGETLSVAFGKIAKAISSLISHLANVSNPHGVTKAQVGLGNVDNTADSAKSVKYATSAGSATTATSATKATQDANGNNIATTYAKASSVLYIVSFDSSTGTLTTKSADYTG